MNKHMPDGKDESIFAPIHANPLDGNLDGAGARGTTTEVQSCSKFLRQNLLSLATTPVLWTGVANTIPTELIFVSFHPQATRVWCESKNN